MITRSKAQEEKDCLKLVVQANVMLLKDDQATVKYVTYRDHAGTLRVSLVDSRDQKDTKSQQDFSIQEFAAHEFRKVKRKYDGLDTTSKPKEPKPPISKGLGSARQGRFAIDPCDGVGADGEAEVAGGGA